MPNDLHNRIIDKFLERYNEPLIDNVDRGAYVECMIALALGDAWRLPKGAWNTYDLEHSATGAWMEVKNSAARQVALPGYDGETAQPSFSIRSKSLYYKPTDAGKGTPLKPPRRTADLYVFAWHPVTGVAADHRRADQWRFYVAPEVDLPDQKTIGLKRVERLAQAVTYDELAGAVEAARAGLTSLKKDTLGGQ